MSSSILRSVRARGESNAQAVESAADSALLVEPVEVAASAKALEAQQQNAFTAESVKAVALQVVQGRCERAWTGSGATNATEASWNDAASDLHAYYGELNRTAGVLADPDVSKANLAQLQILKAHYIDIQKAKEVRRDRVRSLDNASVAVAPVEPPDALNRAREAVAEAESQVDKARSDLRSFNPQAGAEATTNSNSDGEFVDAPLEFAVVDDGSSDEQDAEFIDAQLKFDESVGARDEQGSEAENQGGPAGSNAAYFHRAAAGLQASTAVAQAGDKKSEMSIRYDNLKAASEKSEAEASARAARNGERQQQARDNLVLWGARAAEAELAVAEQKLLETKFVVEGDLFEERTRALSEFQEAEKAAAGVQRMSAAESLSESREFTKVYQKVKDAKLRFEQSVSVFKRLNPLQPETREAREARDEFIREQLEHQQEGASRADISGVRVDWLRELGSAQAEERESAMVELAAAIDEANDAWNVDTASGRAVAALLRQSEAAETFTAADGAFQQGLLAIRAESATAVETLELCLAARTEAEREKIAADAAVGAINEAEVKANENLQEAEDAWDVAQRESAAANFELERTGGDLVIANVAGKGNFSRARNFIARRVPEWIAGWEKYAQSEADSAPHLGWNSRRGGWYIEAGGGSSDSGCFRERAPVRYR